MITVLYSSFCFLHFVLYISTFFIFFKEEKMRKHGWQLPYHPLQVVAVAVFLALGFAFYVFFAPFVGKKMYQYIIMGLYTPLITCVFGLYTWCTAADPADPGVFRSKRYLKIGGELTTSMQDANASIVISEQKDASSPSSSCILLLYSPCAFVCGCTSDQQASEDGIFYCSLCEVEVFKYSKHCRVCDKCVDRFDHHCRWLNNCIGKRNYRKFFTLMVAALLLLILQWLTGILVLICSFVEKKKFSVDISLKLGSSFSLVPFVIVVAVCTMLAMTATLPLAQLFFFHILLIKKGISTYDYIIALREHEHEQQGVGEQRSPQMSPVSSLTGLSSASSFTTFHRGAWCTPPQMFLEDQFDVVPPETASVSSLGKKTIREEPVKKKNPGAVKISPWTLARLNREEVTKAAAEARKKSKILQAVARHNDAFRLASDRSFGSSGRRMVPRIENNRRRPGKRLRLPADLPLEALPKIPANSIDNGFSGTSSLAPQFEAWSMFQASHAVSSSAGVVASSPESSLDSPDIHPFRVSASRAEEASWTGGLSAAAAAAHIEIPFSRSTSDGYEASGGEDSDRVPTRFVQRSANWTNLVCRADQDEKPFELKSSSTLVHNRKL
ncbi:probable protein S-acyltransferase 22 isoform X2 [Arachis hypogaea]|uniref:probable protein S-acyltransferase 22 isoform X2 n=1 Tax=Arachis hypogaea TaxID=3818 RepID=UPI000DED910E|nr:probable protein S-acyltransferase 22 isoform X2 [Arachis hypogaea]